MVQNGQLSTCQVLEKEAPRHQCDYECPTPRLGAHGHLQVQVDGVFAYLTAAHPSKGCLPSVQACLDPGQQEEATYYCPKSLTEASSKRVTKKGRITKTMKNVETQDKVYQLIEDALGVKVEV